MPEYKVPDGQMLKISEGVYSYMQGGHMFCSNSGLIVGEQWCILFDSQTNVHQAERLKAAVKGVTDKPIRLLLNSHWHTDHTWTNHLFPEAVSIASRATREEMKKLGTNEGSGFASVILPHLANFDGAQTTLMDITFEGTMDLYDGIHHMKFIDMGPCHSVSDCVLYLPDEKILFASDLLCETTYGCKEPLCNVWSGSYKAATILQQLLEIPAKIYVPGHGSNLLTPEYAIKYLSAQCDFINICRNELANLYEICKTYQEAAEQFNYSLLTRWSEDTVLLYNQIYANCARYWSEMQGDPPGAEIDYEDIFGTTIMGPGNRLPLGRNYSAPGK